MRPALHLHCETGRLTAASIACTRYITLPIVAILGLGHWLITGRPGWKSAAEIDLVSNVPGPEIDFDPSPPTTKAGKFMRWLL